MRDGLPLPTKIANAPSLQLGLQLYYDAFLNLQTCRPAGLGPTRIPWTAVEQYGQLLQLDDEQRENLHALIPQMDAAYLEWQASKDKG